MRKAIYLLSLLLCLGACSTTEDPVADDSSADAGAAETHQSSIRLNLNVRAATASGVETPRQLTGADSTQLVQSVTIYLFRSDTEEGQFKWYKPKVGNKYVSHIELSDFEKEEVWDIYNPNERHAYWCKDWEIANGWYKVLAVGRDDRFASNPTYMSPWMDVPQENLWPEEMPLEDAWMSICENSDKAYEPLRAPELFAGISEAVIGHTENVTCEVVMSRRIAGVVMNISSIPEKIDGTVVKAVGIVASNATPGVKLESKEPYGASISLSDYITTCLMKAPIPTGATVNASTGLYEDLNTTDNELPTDVLVKGAYITPQANTSFYVVAWAENGSAIKRWPVMLITDEGEKETYPIIANHYYEIDVSLNDLRSGKIVALGEYYGHVYVPL